MVVSLFFISLFLFQSQITHHLFIMMSSVLGLKMDSQTVSIVMILHHVTSHSMLQVQYVIMGQLLRPLCVLWINLQIPKEGLKFFLLEYGVWSAFQSGTQRMKMWHVVNLGFLVLLHHQEPHHPLVPSLG